MKHTLPSGKIIHSLFLTIFVLLVLRFLFNVGIASPSYDSFDTESVYEIETTWYSIYDSSTATELPATFLTVLVFFPSASSFID